MKDVAALCRRVVIIAQGEIKYDGSLTGIVDQFSGQKLITLQLADGQATKELARFGKIVSIEPPKAKLRIERADVPRALAAILAQHTVEDVIVEDPPLEEVIASMFSRVQSAPPE
jgi:ABC-2 type transport system ATP-binding protein